MNYEVELSQKRYYRLIDLASRWKLEVPELLRVVLEQGVGVAILEFRGVDHIPGDTGDDGVPSWAVFIVPDVLKKIGSIGEAYVGGGIRFNESKATRVFFSERRLTAEDLIILPEAYEQLVKIVEGDSDWVQQHESSMSPASRNTLLKQIAALAILLSKQHQGFSYGGKPNSKQIAKAIEETLAKWPPETWGGLKQGFFSKSKINDSIREGLELIGFKQETEDK